MEGPGLGQEQDEAREHLITNEYTCAALAGCAPAAGFSPEEPGRSDGPPGRNDVGPGISGLSALSGFTCTPGAGTLSGVVVLRQRVVIPELQNGSAIRRADRCSSGVLAVSARAFALTSVHRDVAEGLGCSSRAAARQG